MRCAATRNQASAARAANFQPDVTQLRVGAWPQFAASAAIGVPGASGELSQPASAMAEAPDPLFASRQPSHASRMRYRGCMSHASPWTFDVATPSVADNASGMVND
jgi:hypothetical protein